MASRKGQQYAPTLAILQMLLPGAALIYYGDELGMENTPLSHDKMVDVKYKHTDMVLLRLFY